MMQQQKGIVKYLFICAGLLLVAIGGVGIVVPGLPTTIFLLGAAVCFAKSSPCLHSWLVSHSIFGPIIKNWQENRSIPRKAKFLAIGSMLVACIYSWLIIESTELLLAIYVIMLYPLFFVYRLPNSEDLSRESSLS
ncbi:YbaN family protein [Aliikangiella sp. G2MR2-5]|uniref:YbaN family protein n=1 Tax=Aliikangiella sp. G2MR2-5 TaxID=2788943 RepID=UPI0018ABF98B|nr:YbaN family protein [Aliikangiella sp. G2MR2-5]